MFKGLLNQLHREYKSEIYIPDALWVTVKDWICKTNRIDPLKTKGFKWKGKRVLPYNEDKIQQIYQSCPLHIPERITERGIVIVCDLEPTDSTPTQEKPVEATRTRTRVNPNRKRWI